MHCPQCQRRFGFLYSFRVLNPFKHRCRSCGTILTLGPGAAAWIAVAALLGIGLAGFAFYMRESGHWSFEDSVVWLVFALPLGGMAFQWVWWRRASFRRVSHAPDAEKSRIASGVIAGWLFLIPTIQVAVIWYLFLFVATLPNMTAWDAVALQLQYTFSDKNTYFWWFVWLAFVPFACIALAIAYLCGAARTRTGGVTLLAMTIALAIASLALMNWSLALTVALPGIWGYRALYRDRI